MTTTPAAPSATLALAGLALLVFPKAVKTVAYGALALYAFQLYKVYQLKGGSAVLASAKSAYSDAQAQLTKIQKQETEIALQQVSSYTS